MLEQGKVEPIKTEGAKVPTAEKKAAPFNNLTKDVVSPGGQNLDFILDIPVEVTVELGKTKMLVNDLLQLGQGSVVELEKLAGEPVEILVNEKLIARGEVVVVNDKFGVRLTDIISPLDRIKQLNK